MPKPKSAPPPAPATRPVSEVTLTAEVDGSTYRVVSFVNKHEVWVDRTLAEVFLRWAPAARYAVHSAEARLGQEDGPVTCGDCGLALYRGPGNTVGCPACGEA